MPTYPVLIVRKKWADLILDGAKSVEIRGRPCHKRGRVYLSASGPGGGPEAVGHVQLDSCVELRDRAEFERLAPLHLLTGDVGGSGPAAVASALPYARTYAYRLSRPVRLAQPIATGRTTQVTWASVDVAVEEPPVA